MSRIVKIIFAAKLCDKQTIPVQLTIGDTIASVTLSKFLAKNDLYCYKSDCDILLDSNSFIISIVEYWKSFADICVEEDDHSPIKEFIMKFYTVDPPNTYISLNDDKNYNHVLDLINQEDKGFKDGESLGIIDENLITYSLYVNTITKYKSAITIYMA